jgi:hypothetical protein
MRDGHLLLPCSSFSLAASILSSSLYFFLSYFWFCFFNPWSSLGREHWQRLKLGLTAARKLAAALLLYGIDDGGDLD